MTVSIRTFCSSVGYKSYLCSGADIMMQLDDVVDATHRKADSTLQLVDVKSGIEKHMIRHP
jgi:hypothetical protein